MTRRERSLWLKQRSLPKTDAATLGGLEPASAAISPPTLSAWPQKPLILLSRNGHPTGSSMAPGHSSSARWSGSQRSHRQNHEKNHAEAPSMRRRKIVAPGWDLPRKCDGARKDEADEIRISHSNTRALSFVCKIVELSTCRRASRQKSSAKEEMVTPRVGCWPKFEPTIHTRFSRNNHSTYNPVSHKWVGRTTSRTPLADPLRS